MLNFIYIKLQRLVPRPLACLTAYVKQRIRLCLEEWLPLAKRHREAHGHHNGHEKLDGRIFDHD